MVKKKFISIVATLGLVLALALVPVASPVMADVNQTATGSFTVGNAAPVVSAVALKDIGGIDATSMTPQVEYYVNVTVSDANRLNDLTNVTVTIFYDADGSYAPGDVPSGGNTQNASILKWTTSDTWTMDAGSPTSWANITGNCSRPADLTASSGTFKFSFKPGKVATETTGSDRWHIYAVANDGQDTGNNTQQNCTMDWYGAITVNTPSVDWGSVSPGMDFIEGDPSEEGNINVTYIANGAYDEKVAASSPWTNVSANATLDPTGNCTNENEFALKADDTGTLSSAVLADITPTYTAIDVSGNQTTEAGDTVNTNALWLKLAATFTEATYNGSIYYQIADGE